MIFKNGLIPATLTKRYKRFLADVALEDGSCLTVYCPNTGSMRSCSRPGSRVYLSVSANATRKYPHTLEMIEVEGTMVGVNTGLTNAIVAEALEQGKIEEFATIDTIQREVKVSGRSRLDIMVVSDGGNSYIEVKNCSLVEDGIAMFPDAVTVRGTKHLHELEEIVERGDDGVIFYLVQRGDAHVFKPAAHIDGTYAEALKAAHEKGVRILVYQAEVSPEGIRVARPLPYALG